MANTAMQQLIEKLKQSNPKIDFLLWFQSEKVQKELLELEKSNIVDAFVSGNKLEFYDATEIDCATDYYNKTFNNQ